MTPLLLLLFLGSVIGSGFTDEEFRLHSQTCAMPCDMSCRTCDLDGEDDQFNSLYYARIVAQTTEIPVANNNVFDFDGARMLQLNTPYPRLYTPADKRQLFLDATASFYKYFAINITDANYVPSQQIWVVPGVGYMAQTLFGGCADTQSQSPAFYKIAFDTLHLERGQTQNWCSVNPSMTFLFNANGTIQGGLSAGQKYTAGGSIISYTWTNTVRKGYDWSRKQNRDVAIQYTADIGNGVTSSQGYSQFLVKVTREDDFGTAYFNDATQVQVIGGVPINRVAGLILYNKV